jgi:hypothetical protein
MRRSPFVYWPLAGPFLIAAVVVAAVAVAFLQVGIVTYALGRLGVGPGVAAMVLLACHAARHPAPPRPG